LKEKFRFWPSFQARALPSQRQGLHPAGEEFENFFQLLEVDRRNVGRQFVVVTRLHRSLPWKSWTWSFVVVTQFRKSTRFLNSLSLFY